MRLPVDAGAKEFWNKVDPWINEIEIILKGIKDDHIWHIDDGLKEATSLRFENISRACKNTRAAIEEKRELV